MFLGYLNTIMPYRILQAGEDAYLCIMVCKEKKERKKHENVILQLTNCFVWVITV